MLKLHLRNKGFTIVEVVLAIAFVGIAAGMAAPILYSFQARNDLDIAESVYVQLVRQARTLSQAGSHDSAWGVHVASGAMTLFQGSTFASRTAANDKVSHLPDSISFAGDTEVVFEKGTGLPSRTLSLTLTGYGKEGRLITINSQGTAESSVLAPPSGSSPPTFPELSITAPISLTDGGVHTVSSVAAGSAQVITYTIQNTGTGAATLTGLPRVVATGISNIHAVTVTSEPSSTIAAGASSSFSVSFTPALPGAFSLTISVENNDADENPYNWTVSGAANAGTGTPEMGIRHFGVNIGDGNTRNIGTHPGGVASTTSFEIRNTGTGTLFLTGNPRVVVNPLTNVSGVSVVAQPQSFILPGTSIYFQTSYTPNSASVFRFTVSIPNTDSNENPYNWTVRGN